MSQDRDLQLLLLEKITEVGERTARMEVEQKNMKEDLEKVKEQDFIQNNLLAEHIAGVKTQADRLDNEIALRKKLEGRVSNLEEGPRFKAALRKHALKIIAGIAVVAGAAAAVLEVLSYLK